MIFMISLMSKLWILIILFTFDSKIFRHNFKKKIIDDNRSRYIELEWN
jgi:hypothetical protein